METQGGTILLLLEESLQRGLLVRGRLKDQGDTFELHISVYPAGVELRLGKAMGGTWNNGILVGLDGLQYAVLRAALRKRGERSPN
jgi:hypothetical protein